MVVGGQYDNYRALSGKTYEQRINVATSRAKDKLILFHSVQLGTDLSNPDDLRYKLLNYIKNGITEKDLDENKKKKCDSVFEEDVYDWLTERGYEVTPQVEVGAYRIDLVVEGENNRLAVECDGDRWHPPEKWWDDKLRQHQLERVGWTFWRVSGSAFYNDPDLAMSSVIKTLNSLNIKPQKREEESKEIEKNNENQEKDNEIDEVESNSFQIISSQEEITENEDFNLQLDFGEKNELDNEKFDFQDIVKNYDGRTGKVHDVENDHLIVINESGKIEKWKIKDVDLIRPS